MKPTKNRVYCYGCQRSKMLFESKEKADKFIAYNSEGMLEENGKAPVRSYYCEMCGGYHVTSNPSLVAGESLNQRDQRMIEQFANYNKGADEHKKILEDFAPNFMVNAEDLVRIQEALPTLTKLHDTGLLNDTMWKQK